MTDDQITALAREYAVSVNDWQKYLQREKGESPTGFPVEVLDCASDCLVSFLQWLSTRFCLVEKSTVAEEYKRAIETNRKGKETGAHCLCTMGSARKTLLESLFPEIGKEVEG